MSPGVAVVMDGRAIRRGSEPERARRVLWTGVQAFRVASLVWMVVANLIASQPLRHPAVGWAAIAITGLWTAYLLIDRQGHRADVWLWIDLMFVAGLVLLSGYVVSAHTSRIFFATTYPASAPLAWGAARGRLPGLFAGIVLGIALAFERQINGLAISDMSRDQFVGLLNGVVYYLLAGGAAGVVRRTIDRSEEQMRAIAEERERAREQAAEARAEARADAVWLDRFKAKALDLHRSANNVISLAMGLRIVAEKETVSKSDLHGLVSTALQAEVELRDQIKRIREAEFPDHHEGTASLKTAVERAVASVPRIEPVVAIHGLDGIVLPAPACEEVYSATLEALRNVEKYAQASETRVRGEIQDGFAVVSIHDDGRGFEFRPALLDRPGHIGLREEIFGRIEEKLGGKVEVRTRPGGGTEIAMRIPLDQGRSALEEEPTLAH